MKKRFEVIYTQKVIMENIQIIRDTETGVVYLNGYSGGICPLLDSSGKPMIYIDENSIEKE